MKNIKRNSVAALIIALVCLTAALSSAANAQTRKTTMAFARETATQQPLYSEYKSVRLGMTTPEVRAKLGTPAMKDSDQDYYVFSENETAQIGYDAAHKVVTISVDYLGGVGAPDYKTIVGGELGISPSGSLYRMVRYESLGFWVSYNRTTGSVPMVSITIQKAYR